MQTDAVVLDCRDHGETDLIVTMYGRTTGRLSGIAKGAKKSKKRFVNKLELFSFINISYSLKTGRSLAFLADADLHTSFINIRCQPTLYNTATIIREVLLLAVREGETDEQVFRLTLWALHNLDRMQPPLTILSLFLVRFYDLIGYRPDFDACAACRQPVSTEHHYGFAAARGGLCCSRCTPHLEQQTNPLAHGTIKILQSAQRQPLDRLHRLKIAGILQQQALTLLHQYGRHLFQRDIISWRSLGKVNSDS